MTDRLAAAAISQLDGSAQDGVHLLWAAPGRCGLSLDGFTVQRRPARPPPVANCQSLTPAELALLHRDHVLHLTTAEVSVRSTACPVPIPDPPDDPHGDDPPPHRPVCRDLRSLAPQPWPNPLPFQELTLTVRDRNGPIAANSVATIRGFSGLYLANGVDVDLPEASSVVAVTGVHFANPPRVTASNTAGAVVAAGLASPAQAQEWTVQLVAEEITTVRVDAPSDEALLLEVCTNAPRPRAVTPPPHGDPWQGDGGDDDGDERTGCLAYAVRFAAARSAVTVSAAVPAAIAVALRDGKAVATRRLAGVGLLAADFTGRIVDEVVVTTPAPVTELVVCAEPDVPETDVEKEWATVPTLVSGLQLPLRSADPALDSETAEEALAASRLLPGETFDQGAFRQAADLLDDCLGLPGSPPPAVATTTVRADPQSEPIDVRGWALGESLLADPAWRRMAGFGFLDRAAGLTAGSAYDYRISARFRRRDLSERLRGFHTVPDGTTLPANFHLAEVNLRLPGPTAVERYPAAPAVGTRSTGRIGLPVDAAAAGQAVMLALPVATTRLVLELEPTRSANFAWTARTSSFWTGSTATTFAGTFPAQSRVELTFPKPVDRLALTGTGLIYAVCRPAPAAVAAFGQGAPDDPITLSTVLRGVRFEPTAAPPPPGSIGTARLQQPLVEVGPAEAMTPRPPSGIGFSVTWSAPPAGPDPVAWWPADLAAVQPSDVAGYRVEHRRVDTSGPFQERDGGTGLSTLVSGNRAVRDVVPVLVDGCDLLVVFPESPAVVPPVSGLVVFTDVLEGDTADPPPGSLHQYRVFSVDAVGRRSTTAATGSVVRLEKWLPPPLPVAPDAAAPDDDNPDRPRGVRAKVLQATAVAELTAADRAELGASRSAVVLEWGWTDDEHRRDPWTTEFRVYWQASPPDVVTVDLGPAALVNGRWEAPATLDRAVAVDAFASRTIVSAGVAFRIYGHAAGLAATFVLDLSRVSPDTPPAPSRQRLRPVLRGGEQRPARWTERVATVPLSAASSYRYVVRDRLLPGPDTPVATGWVGVSAADGQSYVPDEILAPRPLAGRAGNESSVVPVAVTARYLGRPAFTPPVTLGVLPEMLLALPANARDAGGTPVVVDLNLPSILPGVAVPAGHRVVVERLGLDEVAAVLGVADDQHVRVSPPGVAPVTYTLPDPADQATVVRQIRTGNAARVESRFLVDAVLGHGVEQAFDPLWTPAAPAPVEFGRFTDWLTATAQRVIYRVRLADAARHVSARGAVARRVVRVPSASVPATPRLEVAPSRTDAVTAVARMPDAYDVSHLLLFQHDVDLTARGGLDTPAQLLSLADRRGLGPDVGVRLRTAATGLLEPVVVPVADGVPEGVERVFTVPLPAVGHDRQVLVWAVALTRDGILSRPARSATPPVPSR